MEHLAVWFPSLMRRDFRLLDRILELDLISRGVIMKRYFSVTCYCSSLIFYTKQLNQIILVSSVPLPRSLAPPSRTLPSFTLFTPPDLIRIPFRTFLVLFQGKADLTAVFTAVVILVGTGAREAGRCGSWSIQLNHSFWLALWAHWWWMHIWGTWRRYWCRIQIRP